MNTNSQSVEDRAMLNELAALTLRVATPLVWHDRTLGWPKPLLGGTCFFLRFETGVIGITANHVVDAYQRRLQDNPNTVCQIRTSSAFDLTSQIIDRNETRDIATFAVDEKLLREISAVVIDCRENWPPPMPELMRALSVCGFPEEMRKTTVDHEAIFEAWGALPAIEAFTERDILITFDPLRDQPSPWAVGGLPPLGLNLSGASGGPALMYGIHRGLLRWFPVGLVIGGPKGRGEGALSEFDIISIRRIHVVENDGKIRKDNDGWLP